LSFGLCSWAFFKDYRNCVDLGLAIITAIDYRPVIPQSGQTYDGLHSSRLCEYASGTAVSLTRELIKKFSSGVADSSLSLIVFVFLINLPVCDLRRPDLPR